MNKILFISHSSGGGGAEIVLLEVIKILNNNYNLTVVFPNNNKNFLSNEVQNFNIKTLNLKLPLLFKEPLKKTIKSFIRKGIPSTISLYKYIKKNNIEFVYSNTSVNYIGAFICILAKKKHFWHIHELANNDSILPHKCFDFILAFLLKKSTLIFISKGVKESFFKRFNLKEGEVEYKIIYNPLKNLNLNKSVINNKNIAIGCVGTFSENKNQKALIETFVKLIKEFPNIILKLAGVGNIQGASEIINNRLDSKNYKLFNYIDSQAIYEELDILVVPSFNESWSLTAIEGATAGLIPLITNTSSISEIFKEPDNAFFFDPFLEEDLYLKLKYILSNFLILKDKITKNNSILLLNLNFNQQFQDSIIKLFKK